MKQFRPAALIAFALLGIAMGPVANAQEKCTDPDSVGCDWDPNYGWVKRGTVPSSSSSGGENQSQPVDQAQLEQSMARYQREKAQQREDAAHDAAMAADDARIKAINQANLPGPGYCYLAMLGGPGGLNEEAQRGMIEYSTKRCLDDHNPDHCFSLAVDHSTYAIPEAHPEQAYHFMKLACQYGGTEACEAMETQCIPN